jgi:hypothetical protein
MSFFLPTAVPLLAFCLLTPPSGAGDKPKTPSGIERPEESAAAAKTARTALAKFAKGDPGWRVRMESLVGLAKAGPAVAPVLVKALKDGSPLAREFAAQALAVVAEPSTRPALVRALEDPEAGVRVHAVKALTMFGPLELTDRQRQVLEDRSHWMLRHYIGIAMSRDDKPNPSAIRKALSEYDLSQMDIARLGHLAPDFSLPDAGARSYRLSQFNGQKMVVLEFHTGDG